MGECTLLLNHSRTLFIKTSSQFISSSARQSFIFIYNKGSDNITDCSICNRCDPNNSICSTGGEYVLYNVMVFNAAMCTFAFGWTRRPWRTSHKHIVYPDLVIVH